MGLTSAALSLTVTRAAQHDNARELSRLRTERDTALRQLDTVRSELHLQKTVHETLARVAARGGGEDAITQALYELTGLSALIEDRFGNLRSWAGPDRPDRYPVRSSTYQEEILRRVARDAGPVRVKDRLIALARPRGDLLALRALEVRQNSRQSSGTTFFDELGLYRILGPGNSLRGLEGFVREWLGQLIDYDAGHDTELVETLSRYFDCGGNYDDAAAALTVRRSTLRYRLQRIREISDRDLADVGPAQSAGGNARLEDHPGQAALTAATRRAGAAGQPGCRSPPTHVLERCYPCVRGLPPTSPCARGLTGWERRHCAPGQ
ncbi:PucR family transcriptional regulator [Streptomyces avermitilis]|uniref:PucR family transcriptional regulator n=1 Tax=Streptomyces avermitilis TaxID=33903 RepID=UPI0033A00A4B